MMHIENQKKTNFVEIDFLRNIAAIFMILNHAVVELSAYRINIEPMFKFVGFIGSFAPVVFFFVTGVGVGIGHKMGRLWDPRKVLPKVLLLIIADIFLRLKHFPVYIIGWDFFAFIAFSMLFVSILRGRKHTYVIMCIIISIIIFIRFLFGPLFLKSNLSDGSIILRNVFGMSGINGISYWFIPWLIYPSLGYCFAPIIKKLSMIKYRLMVIFISLFLGILLVVCSLLLKSFGFELFRWGMISINYFIASIACLCFCICFVISISIVDFGNNNLFALRGVSSFAVVPIHYYFISITTYFNVWPKNEFVLSIYIIGLIIVVLVIANRGVSLFNYFNGKMSVINIISTGILITLIPVQIIVPKDEMLQLTISVFGMILICYKLSIRNNKRLKNADVR